MARPHATWSRHITRIPAERAAPISEAEVAALVQRAAAARRHVKVIGGGHSFSDIGLTDGVLVTLDRMRAVVHLDAARHRVTVQAGIRLHELIAALASRNLALPILGSVTTQSIAGAISTGTHGSSLQHRNLASLVCGMRLVTARGDVLQLDEPDDRLAGARVGLGALGIITEVTLRCEPLFTLVEEARRVPVDQLIRDLDAIARSAEYVKIWWLPTLPFANVYRYTRTDRSPTTSSLRRWVDEAIVNRFLFAALLAMSRRWPRLTPAINRAVGATYLRESRRVGRYDQVLTVAMPPVHRETEYAVALARASEALDRVRALIQHQRLRVNFVMEIRFVKGDDAWMSPTYGRDSCQIGAYIADGSDREAYFTGFERIMHALGGRPHWGKEHNITPEQVSAVFPMADRFLTLRGQLDPDGVFDNACLRRAFG
jgi:FAD-linked oxidoreductase